MRTRTRQWRWYQCGHADGIIGARGLGRGSLFQLAWRDIHTAVSQITMAWDIQVVNAGRIVFGLPSRPVAVSRVSSVLV